MIQVSQDAAWLRRMSGEREPRARREGSALRRIERDTWMRERFHLGFFVFYCLCSALALLQGRGLWCFVLMVANALYNLYPIWLQQYLRLRVERCLMHGSGPSTRR